MSDPEAIVQAIDPGSAGNLPPGSDTSAGCGTEVFGVTPKAVQKVWWSPALTWVDASRPTGATPGLSDLLRHILWLRAAHQRSAPRAHTLEVVDGVSSLHHRQVSGTSSHIRTAAIR